MFEATYLKLFPQDGRLLEVMKNTEYRIRLRSLVLVYSTTAWENYLDETEYT